MTAGPSTAAAEAAAAWGLELIEKTASRYSDTWFALRGEQHVVLKVGDPTARNREAAALCAYARTPGATAALIGRREGALLLQRVLPGDDLRPVAAADDDAATTVVGSVIERLHRAAAPPPPHDHALPALATISDTFARYEERGSDRLPAPVVDRAKSLTAELTVPGPGDLVLHGDLHHDNILRALPSGAAPDREGAHWVAIDPHGWIGDPAFDTAASLLNPHEAIAGAPDPGALTRRRSAILAEVTGLDRDRIVAWALVGAVISELWCLEDHDFVAGAPLRLAESLMS